MVRAVKSEVAKTKTAVIVTAATISSEITSFLEDTNRLNGIAKVAAAGVDPRKLASNLIRSAMTDPGKLCEVFRTPQGKLSILNAMIYFARLGIEPDGTQAHLLPFRNGKAQVTTYTPVIGYRAALAMAYELPMIKAVDCQLVYENDVFELDLAHPESTKHRPPSKCRPRGSTVGGYMMVETKDGGKFVACYMTKDDFDALAKKDYDSPWQTHRPAMEWKTIALHGCRRLPCVKGSKIEALVKADIQEEIGQSDELAIQLISEKPASTTATPGPAMPSPGEVEPIQMSSDMPA